MINNFDMLKISFKNECFNVSEWSKMWLALFIEPVIFQDTFCEFFSLKETSPLDYANSFQIVPKTRNKV